jgi:BirA family biotin operon repressor/biotin-[acetyl-CoA-carboxylase] ligase
VKNELNSSITAQEISACIANKKLGQKIYCFDVTTSTNDEAKRRAQNKNDNGALFVASAQIQGRGRLGRTWVSPQGGAYFTLLLNDLKSDIILTKLYIVSSLAVAESIENIYNLKVSIKWPNDLMIQNKKVSGILAEAAWEAGRQKYLIIGIGINVNTLLSQLPEGSTSLYEVSGLKKITPKLIGLTVDKFSEYYDKLCNNTFGDLHKLWNCRCDHFGSRIVISRNNILMHGMLLGIDEGLGSLLIRKDNGIIETIESVDKITIMRENE